MSSASSVACFKFGFSAPSKYFFLGFGLQFLLNTACCLSFVICSTKIAFWWTYNKKFIIKENQKENIFSLWYLVYKFLFFFGHSITFSSRINPARQIHVRIVMATVINDRKGFKGPSSLYFRLILKSLNLLFSLSEFPILAKLIL